ncbi:hypothetical protein [Mucilaginibacter glaciei]|uniref:DUF2281 domain-containing protein n=1 Tax=Mucilaginibacter glaciei TaxID=2772109 RepID=A0A926S2S6_9SPHI|nr:hypothetical protein [Mucilaginibacter glaciei]MBD1394463.1 hypothetical protein [Mucilaginibacter glaciei]
MVRTILKPENQSVLLNVPENFVGKQVEIIAFTIDEAQSKDIVREESLTFQASEKALSKDWLTIEEDVAWQNL